MPNASASNESPTNSRARRRNLAARREEQLAPPQFDEIVGAVSVAGAVEALGRVVATSATHRTRASSSASRRSPSRAGSCTRDDRDCVRPPKGYTASATAGTTVGRSSDWPVDCGTGSGGTHRDRARTAARSAGPTQQRRDRLYEDVGSQHDGEQSASANKPMSSTHRAVALTSELSRNDLMLLRWETRLIRRCSVGE